MTELETLSQDFLNAIRDGVQDLLRTYPHLSNEGNAFAMWATGFIHQLDEDEALEAVAPRIEGPGDGGIDAVITDDLSEVVYLMQAKYSSTLDKTFDERPAAELMSGLNFNKVNRYAKTTSRSDNIITSEDDGYAIVTRRLVDDGAALGIKYKGELIIDWKSNTIAARSLKLTTISAIYETVKDILHAEGFASLDEKVRVTRPAEDELDRAFDCVERWWLKLMAGIPAFQAAATDASKLPKMREESDYGLLLRPNGQITLLRGLSRAVHRGVDLDTAIERAARLSWKLDDPMWHDLLVKSNGGMIARSENYDVAADLIAYLVGSETMTDAEIDAVSTHYRKLKGDEYAEVPTPVAA